MPSWQFVKWTNSQTLRELTISSEKHHDDNSGFNPVPPKSEKHLIFPNSITPKSNIKFMKIKEMIGNSKSSWLLDKISLQAP